MARRLEAAGRILFSLDARRRQLSARQRALITSTRRGRWTILKLFFTGMLVLLPSVACALLFGLTPYPSYSLATICGAPPALLGVIGTALVLLSFRRRRGVEAACAAVPPAVRGGPARCRVCGAPLAEISLAERGIARCAYCHADNLVEPALLQRMGATRSAHIENFEDAVRRHASAVAVEHYISLAMVSGVIIGSPAICLLTSGIAYRVAPLYEGIAPGAEIAYVLVATELGTCIGRVHGRYDDGSAHVLLGHLERRDLRSVGYPAGAGAVEPLPPTWVLGRNLRWLANRDRVETGRAARIYRSLLEPRTNMVAIDGGLLERRHSIEGTCLVDPPPPGTRVFAWPGTRAHGAHRLPGDTSWTDPRMPH